jgi:peptide/nickel transport system permease protein
MTKYLMRRMVLFIPTLFVGTLLVFTIMRVLPGDLAQNILSQEAAETGSEVDLARLEHLRETLGLNDPLPVQYGKWIWSMVNGEFGGKTLVDGEPIKEVLAFRLPKTLELGLLGFGLSIILGIPLGVIAAVYQDKWPDYVIRMILVGGLSIPSFWLALMMLLVGLLVFNYVPPLGYVGPTEDFIANMQIMWMPAFILGFHGATGKARVVRAQILDVLRQDYIRTARSKGMQERIVLWRHAMKNAMIPVVTIAGLNLVTLIGGTVILESIFGIPGIGTGLVEGVRERDYTLVQSLVTFFLFITMVGNLTVDISYAWLDPRIKYS